MINHTKINEYIHNNLPKRFRYWTDKIWVFNLLVRFCIYLFFNFNFNLLFSGNGWRNNDTNSILINSLLSNILLHRFRLAIFNLRIPLRVVFSTAFFMVSAFDLPPHRCKIFLTSLWDDSPPCSLSSPKPCLNTFSWSTTWCVLLPEKPQIFNVLQFQWTF